MAAMYNIAVTQLAQLGLAEKVVQNSHVQPELQKQLAQDSTPELLRKENAAIPKTDDSQKSRSIKADDRKGSNGAAAQNKAQRKKKTIDESDSDETLSSDGSAWTGKLLNLKV